MQGSGSDQTTGWGADQGEWHQMAIGVWHCFQAYAVTIVV
jgi:hypothetical protein